jgi:hypothetical protein
MMRRNRPETGGRSNRREGRNNGSERKKEYCRSKSCKCFRQVLPLFQSKRKRHGWMVPIDHGCWNGGIFECR